MTADTILGKPRTRALLLKSQVSCAMPSCTKTTSLWGLATGSLACQGWLEKSFEALDIPQVIDVYHASSYLETVMVEMAWSAWERAWERKQWQEGKVDARQWLKRYLPAEEKRLGWSLA